MFIYITHYETSDFPDWDHLYLYTPYHPAHGYQGLLCITDYVEFYTILHKRLLKMVVVIIVLFYIKCFMQLKTFKI
jgi:hypothetical protein